MSKEEKKKEDDKKKEEKKKELVLMRKGDYSVHVLIEELKDLQNPGEELHNPVVKMICMDKEQRTSKPPEPCTEITLNEHFYFEKTNMTVEELDSSKIVFHILDYKTSKKKQDYFGIYEFDFGYIYNQENHCLRNNWLALANPESEDMTLIRGYMKFSISVLEDNDPRVELNPKENSDNNFILPSQISSECKQVTFNIYKAEGIPDTDSIKSKKVNKSCDGYVKILYLGTEKRTSVQKMKNDIITWNEAIDLPVTEPVVSSKLVIQLWDEDVGSDDIIGSLELNVNDILADKFSSLQYYHIYGSTTLNDNKVNAKMNANPEYGSGWKGKVLMQITCKRVESASLRLRTIDDQEQLKNIYSTSPQNLWNYKFKLYGGYFLPSLSKKYQIRIEVQEQYEIFPEREIYKGYATWNLVKNFRVLSYANCPEELPDIFIYLVSDKSTKICFQRIKASTLYMNQESIVLKLMPEPAVDKVKKMSDAGVLKLKATVFNKNEGKDVSYADNIRSDSEGDNDGSGSDLEMELLAQTEDETKNEETYVLAVNVHMTRGLVSKDSKGTNDPYVDITCNDANQHTDYKENTINGIWNEKLVFDNVKFKKGKRSTWPILFTQVLDHNSLSKNSLIAVSYIFLSDMKVSWNNPSKTVPTWVPLYTPNSNKQQGELLLSFNIFNYANYNLHQEIQVTPECVPYSFEINVLGLRSLKPLSLFPVKKAFIKFDLNSLNVAGASSEGFQPVSTQPREPGCNPNIITVIKFDLNLPKQTTFMPQLQCEIYDSILNGLMNPLLGVFMINIQTLVTKTNLQINQDKKAMGVKVDDMLGRGPLGLRARNKRNVVTIADNAGPAPMRSKNKPKRATPTEQPQEGMSELNEQTDNGNKNKNDSNLVPNDNEVTNVEIDESKEKPKKSEKVKREGTVSWNEVDKHKDDSEFYVILPKFVKRHIPGTKKDDKNYQEFEIEDKENVPDDEDYFPIGYIRPKNLIPDVAQTNEPNNENQEIKMSSLESQNENQITKHYRRIYGKELERVKEVKFRSPFYEVDILRGAIAEDDSPDAIFDCVANDKNKILKKYSVKESTNVEEKKEESKNGDTLVDEQSETEIKKKSKKTDGKKPRKKGDPDKKKVVGKRKRITNNSFGLFKGIVRICEKSKMDEYLRLVENYKKNNKQIADIKNLNKYEDLTRRLLVPTKVLIRIYVLELNDLAKKDYLNESDPYIKIYINDKLIVDEVKSQQNDKKNCQWYKHYDINGEFPGDSTLSLQVWDYDPIFSDELIGATSIDLEDRFYSQEWRDMKNKPIEKRSLYHPDFTASQGYAILWVEIFEKSDKSTIEPWIIEPEPPIPVQVRFIVWETEGLKNADIEDTSDVFVTGYINPHEKQTTDTHFRCQTGCASFNWRMVFNITLPADNKPLIIGAYDKDLFKKNDFLGGTSLCIRDLYSIVKDFNVPITLSKEYVDGLEDEAEKSEYKGIEFDTEDKENNKFWISIFNQSEMAGRILCSLEVLPMWKAELTKVGLGRDEPNVSPFLPPPTGRFQFSLNPFSMINQCVGPKFRKKCYLIICGVCCFIYLCFIVPYIILHLISEVANPFNYFK